MIKHVLVVFKKWSSIVIFRQNRFLNKTNRLIKFTSITKKCLNLGMLTSIILYAYSQINVFKNL